MAIETPNIAQDTQSTAKAADTWAQVSDRWMKAEDNLRLLSPVHDPSHRTNYSTGEYDQAFDAAMSELNNAEKMALEYQTCAPLGLQGAGLLLRIAIIGRMIEANEATMADLLLSAAYNAMGGVILPV